ncbi:glucose 1-dehydrogenase [Chloroflexota bacterium]
MGRLDSKVALITGAAMGMGEASAKLFAKEGARVAVADINEAKGKEVVEGIRKGGGEAIFVKLDVRKESDWTAGIDKVTKTYGKLNVLVNNAGIIVCVLFEETTLEQWNRIMEVNATGVFLGIKYGARAMKANGELCSIINRSSTGAKVAAKNMAAYGASKGAVSTLTKQAAIAFCEAGYKIRVNSVIPCEVHTPMAEQEAREFGMSVEDYLELRRKGHPIGRIGKPIDIAYADLYLASDESSWATGSEFVIDGGVLAR